MLIKCPSCHKETAFLDKKDLSITCSSCHLTRKLASRAELRRLEHKLNG